MHSIPVRIALRKSIEAKAAERNRNAPPGGNSYKLLNMVTNRTLGKIAVIGAAACIGTGLVLTYKIRNTFKKSSYYKESLQLLLSHRGAVGVLGQPIKVGDIDLGNTKDNYVDGREARLALSVKGSKDEGKLYLRARRSSLEDPWCVQRLELEIKSDSTRRLVVHKTDDESIK